MKEQRTIRIGRHGPSACRPGVAYILAVFMLATCTMVAATFAQEGSINMRKSANLVHQQNARLQAESGVAYLGYILRVNGLSAAGGSAAMNELAQKLPGWIAGSLKGQEIVCERNNGNVTKITLPPMSPGGDGSFSTEITLADNQTLQVRVPGMAEGCGRGVGIQFNIAPGRPLVCGYGVSSRGPVSLVGNATIRGANNAMEGSILSTTLTTPTAIDLNGNCTVSGDVYIGNPNGNVHLNGNTSIGGKPQSNPDISDHIHIGASTPEFPLGDPTVFKSLATTIVDSHTNTNGNKTFTNILIKANTNPTFSGNITLKGIVYIETPNNVSFTGNLTLTGVVAADDPGPGGSLASNGIRFNGNTTIQGVENLPSTPEFADLKTMTGTFLVAPGHSVTFTGNFGTVNGAMAANEFKWAGNAGGIVRGSIINWGDTPFTLQGNSSLTFDQRNTGGLPGLICKAKLTALANTYEEF